MAIWSIHGTGKTVDPGKIVAPEERLTWPRTIGFGFQHVVAMFGATFLVPTLTGFPPSTTLLFSGVGTLLFLMITRNRMPSYLGSSFAFISPLMAATATGGHGAAIFGVLVSGVLLALVGLLVSWVGTRWIDVLMPPVVAGAIVALIGFNLAPAAYSNFEQAPVTASITLGAVLICAVLFRGFLGRLSILFGVVIGYATAALRGEIDFAPVADAEVLGLPVFTAPEPNWAVLPAFLPVVLVLVAENVGHIKGVASMTRRNLDPLTGRALFADGLATALAGSAGGSGTTTYGENIGVMASTRVYSTATYWVAGFAAILLALSPKVGAIINTIPPGVLGGVTTALYGLIGIIGVRIWVDNKVDFGKPVNQMTAAVALIVAIADFTLTSGTLVFTGIALGSIAAIVVYHGMSLVARWRGTDVSAGGELLAPGEEPQPAER